MKPVRSGDRQLKEHVLNKIELKPYRPEDDEVQPMPEVTKEFGH
jgi:hypothetical protein